MKPRLLTAILISMLAGCALIPTVSPHLSDGVRADAFGRRMAWLLSHTTHLEELDNTQHSFTVFIPDDTSWPQSYWQCLSAPQQRSNLDAQMGRYVIAVRWGPHLSSPAPLEITTQAGDRRVLLVTGPHQATVDGIAVTGMTRWLNGNLVHIAHPLPPPEGSGCVEPKAMGKPPQT